MAEAYGETVSFSARISGEIQPADIPTAPGVDIDAIKDGDKNSLEIVVEVPSSKSKRGWDYKPQAIKDIVDHVNVHTLSGFLGHQKQENLETEFPTPVAHWVGASWDDNKKAGYFRGVIDPAAENLKRWIRAKRVKEVSIYGIPKLKQSSGETSVVGYKPLSIDFVPIGRPGMPTSIVATGEMDEIAGELDGSHEELREALRTAAKALFGDGPGSYTWVRKVFDSYVIVEHEKDGLSKLYSIPYGVVDGEVKLGEKTEVVEKKTYEPVGEIYGGEGSMGWKELVSY